MSAEGLRSLSRTALATVAAALESGRLMPPFTAFSLNPYVGGGQGDAAANALGALAAAGASARAIAMTLRYVEAERDAVEKRGDGIELVWTGPEARNPVTRDTAVVARELFSTAKESVLVASYALHQSARVFEPLARRMEDRPGLDVKLVVNVARPFDDQATSDAELLRRFAEEFRSQHWSGARLPAVYFDPRALAPAGSGPRSCLHAKCIVVDGTRILVTSANFTEAAHERNIETGLLVEDSALALGLTAQFEGLIESGRLRSLLGP